LGGGDVVVMVGGGGGVGWDFGCELGWGFVWWGGGGGGGGAGDHKPAWIFHQMAPDGTIVFV